VTRGSAELEAWSRLTCAVRLGASGPQLAWLTRSHGRCVLEMEQPPVDAPSYGAEVGEVTSPFMRKS